ncbi:MAG: anaerobic ribonucleoside-triphosphate reductase, partial [archaeon]|nr:anaerobic ribonucleoside-triphosphate reductase [archaeon]
CARGDEAVVYEKLDSAMELAAKAHLQKKEFIRKILALGSASSLPILTMNLDGEPYYRFDKASFLLGILGLNELVQSVTGEEMHESVGAYKYGLKITAYMRKRADELGKKYNIHMPLEQTPAESAAYRMAKLDMEHYPKATEKVVRGVVGTSSIYYTNSTYFNIGAPMSPIERVTKEGTFHPLIDAGAMTHVWLGEAQPEPRSLTNFVMKTFKNTQNTQIAFSPEMTLCKTCHNKMVGLKDTCDKCSEVRVKGITRCD